LQKDGVPQEPQKKTGSSFGAYKYTMTKSQSQDEDSGSKGLQRSSTFGSKTTPAFDALEAFKDSFIAAAKFKQIAPSNAPSAASGSVRPPEAYMNR